MFLAPDPWTPDIRWGGGRGRGQGGVVLTMRTSSQRLAAVRKREAMLLASVNCSSRCLNLGSYLRRGGGGFKTSTFIHDGSE